MKNKIELFAYVFVAALILAGLVYAEVLTEDVELKMNENVSFYSDGASVGDSPVTIIVTYTIDNFNN